MLDDIVLDKPQTPVATTTEIGAGIATTPAETTDAVIFENLVRQKTTDYLKNAPAGEIYNILRADFERHLFEATMLFVHNNQVQAAKILGISRGTLRKRLKEFGML